MNPTPGWYGDPGDPTRLRWWDGARWTEPVTARPPAPVATTPAAYGPGDPRPFMTPAPRAGTSTGVKVLIGLGAGLVVLVLLGVLAAVAIPVVLEQRRQAELGALDCAQVAVDAVALSQQEAGTDLIPLVELADPVLVQDGRPDFTMPSPGSEAYVLTCEGDGVWADGVVVRTWVDVYVDHELEPALSLGWEE